MRSIRAGVVASAILLWQAPAAAGDPVVAREQLKIGYTLAQEGKCEEAVPHFLESLRLDPKAITLINLADCEEKLGKLADAMGHWVDARARAQTEGARAIEEEAEARATALEPRLARLTIVLSPNAPKDAVVERDGIALGRPSLGIPLPLDPGSHKLVVKAKGYPDGVFEVSLGEGERKSLEVDVGGPPLPQEPTPAPPASDASSRPTSTSPSPLVFVGFGAALAGAALGTITGIMALNAGSTAKDMCPNQRCATQADLDAVNEELASGRAMGTISTVSFVVAGVGAAVGVTALLTGSKGSPKTSHPTVGVSLTPSFVSLRGRF